MTCCQNTDLRYTLKTRLGFHSAEEFRALWKNTLDTTSTAMTLTGRTVMDHYQTPFRDGTLTFNRKDYEDD